MMFIIVFFGLVINKRLNNQKLDTRKSQNIRYNKIDIN